MPLIIQYLYSDLDKQNYSMEFITSHLQYYSICKYQKSIKRSQLAWCAQSQIRAFIRFLAAATKICLRARKEALLNCRHLPTTQEILISMAEVGMFLQSHSLMVICSWRQITWKNLYSNCAKLVQLCGNPALGYPFLQPPLLLLRQCGPRTSLSPGELFFAPTTMVCLQGAYFFALPRRNEEIPYR